jgi:hypothetical protein
MFNKNTVFPIIFTIILATVFTVLFGYFFYGSIIFGPKYITFQFIVSGFVGSIFYALLKYKGLRVAILALVTLYVLDLSLLRITKPHRMLTHLLYFAALAGALYLYYRYVSNRIVKVKVGKFVFLSILLAGLNIIVMTIHGLIISQPDISANLIKVLRMQLLAGVGLGLGFETVDLVYAYVFGVKEISQ